MFGFSDAVLGFNAVSKFLETVARRLLLLLTTMYYDDASTQDLTSGYGCAQVALDHMFSVFGFRLKAEKRLLMQSQGTDF